MGTVTDTFLSPFTALPTLFLTSLVFFLVRKLFLLWFCFSQQSSSLKLTVQINHVIRSPATFTKHLLACVDCIMNKAHIHTHWDGSFAYQEPLSQWERKGSPLPGPPPGQIKKKKKARSLRVPLVPPLFLLELPSTLNSTDFNSKAG